MNKFYTAQEVADKLKIKKTTVYELIKRGELSSSKIGKQLRVSEEQLAQYLDGAAQISTAAQTRDYQPESSLLKMCIRDRAGTTYRLHPDSDLTFLHNGTCIGNAAFFLTYKMCIRDRCFWYSVFLRLSFPVLWFPSP